MLNLVYVSSENMGVKQIMTCDMECRNLLSFAVLKKKILQTPK